DRAVGEHARIHEVNRRDERVAGPQADAAVAARGAGGVIIATFAMIAVVVVHHVPVIDDKTRGVFGPDIDGAAGERFAFPGDERGAVGAMGDTVVFPGEIVKALADEPAIGFEILLLIALFVAGGDAESFSFA